MITSRRSGSLVIAALAYWRAPFPNRHADLRRLGSEAIFIHWKDDGMTSTVLRLPAGTGRGSRSVTQLLDVNPELGTATVRVDLSEVTEATAPVVSAARLAVNALIGQVLAERLLGLDIVPTNSYLDVAIPDRNPVVVHVSLATEPRRLLKALQSNGVSPIEVDVMVFDGNLAQWARGRMEWTIRQRRSAEWPVNSP
jgi:hypothetical protein